MAKVTVVQPKPIKQPPRKIILELSEGEADFILGITGYVSGDMRMSPRKYCERIRVALRQALGHDYHLTDAHELVAAGRAELHFNEYPARG